MPKRLTEQDGMGEWLSGKPVMEELTVEDITSGGTYLIEDMAFVAYQGKVTVSGDSVTIATESGPVEVMKNDILSVNKISETKIEDKKPANIKESKGPSLKERIDAVKAKVKEKKEPTLKERIDAVKAKVKEKKEPTLRERMDAVKAKLVDNKKPDMQKRIDAVKEKAGTPAKGAEQKPEEKKDKSIDEKIANVKAKAVKEANPDFQVTPGQAGENKPAIEPAISEPKVPEFDKNKVISQAVDKLEGFANGTAAETDAMAAAALLQTIGATEDVIGALLTGKGKQAEEVKKIMDAFNRIKMMLGIGLLVKKEPEGPIDMRNTQVKPQPPEVVPGQGQVGQAGVDGATAVLSA